MFAEGSFTIYKSLFIYMYSSPVMDYKMAVAFGVFQVKQARI